MKRLLLISTSLLLVPVAQADNVILDDLIVDGSACIGFDCVNGESFGFDTLRLKENNLRVHFDDTSTSASFPPNDWRIRINDSSNGGDSYFAIEDASAGRTPFRVEAGARENALFVESTGDIGVGTNNPVTDIHISTGDTPTLRLEQNGSSGWNPQTWDVAGNETNFFIRDASNGSTLPFRIRPGASTSSIEILGSATSSSALLGVGPNLSSGVVATSTTTSKQAFRATHSGGGDFDGAALFESTAATGATAGGIVRVQTPQDAANNVVFLNMSANGVDVFKFTSDGSVLINGTDVHPDYVFEPDYELMPVEELEIFVEKNKHLPGIPSADNVSQNGLDLTGLSVRLLEKIEELTLYTIEQQKQIDSLHSRLAELDATQQ